MTQLLIDVVDISGGTHPDDKVRLWAPQHRPDGERVVSTSPVDVKLAEGKATVEVLPGPARVQIMTKGVVDSAPKKVTIPDEQSVTLRAVIEDGLEWEPEVISRVATLTSRAESAADRAETVATTFGSLEGVSVSVHAAEDAATAAASSATTAEGHATAAGASAGDAAAQADRSRSEADRAEAAAQSASTGVQADTVGRLHLTPALRGEIDEKVTAEHGHAIEDVTGLQPELDARAPLGHTHPEYATTEQVNARTPEIRTVSSPELATSPGVLYVVMEG